MSFIHNVAISWNDLLDAFSNKTNDHVYFLDRFTGEVFGVPTTIEGGDFLQQIETHQERFLEIPRLDYTVEKKLLANFLHTTKNKELKQILEALASGNKLFGKTSDVLSFFPEEHERMLEMQDDFVTDKVKYWLEENNLFSMENNPITLSSAL